MPDLTEEEKEERKKQRWEKFGLMWDKLSSPEKLYVLRNMKMSGKKDKGMALKKMVKDKNERRKLMYYAKTNKDINIGEEGVYDIPTSDRLKQSLAKNPNVSVSYLNKKFPESEFVNYFGEVHAKKRDSDESFLPIEEGGFLAGDGIKDKAIEYIKDTTEMTPALVRMGLETAASAGGGVVGGLLGSFGGPTSTVLGALTGSSIAGAEMAGFTERAKTALGRAFGLDQHSTPEEIQQAKKMGFLAPLLGGSGSGIKLAQKAIKTKLGTASAKRAGLTAESAAEKLYRAQSGVPMQSLRGAQNFSFGPMAGNTFVEPKMLRERMPKIIDMETSGKTPTEFFREYRERFTSDLHKARTGVIQNLRDAVPEEGSISTKGVYKAWGDALNDLKKVADGPTGNEIDQEIVEEALANFHKHTSKQVPSKGFVEKNVLDVEGKPIEILDASGKGKLVTEQVEVATKTREILPETISPKEAADLVMKLRNLDDFVVQQNVSRNATDTVAQGHSSEMSNALAKISKDAIRSLDHQLGNLPETGAKYIKAKDEYKTFRALENNFRKDGVINDRKFFTTAMNLAKPSTARYRSTIAEMDEKYGTSFIPNSKDIALYTKYGKTTAGAGPDLGVDPPGNFMNTNPRSIPAGMVGMALGGGAGHQTAPEEWRNSAAIGGAMAGGLLGLKSVAPWMARSMLGSFPRTKSVLRKPGVQGAIGAAERGAAQNYNELPIDDGPRTSVFGQELPRPHRPSGMLRTMLEGKPNFNIMSPYNMLPYTEEVGDDGLLPLYDKKAYMRHKGMGAK